MAGAGFASPGSSIFASSLDLRRTGVTRRGVAQLARSSTRSSSLVELNGTTLRRRHHPLANGDERLRQIAPQLQQILGLVAACGRKRRFPCEQYKCGTQRDRYRCVWGWELRRPCTVPVRDKPRHWSCHRSNGVAVSLGSSRPGIPISRIFTTPCEIHQQLGGRQLAM